MNTKINLLIGLSLFFGFFSTLQAQNIENEEETVVDSTILPSSKDPKQLEKIKLESERFSLGMKDFNAQFRGNKAIRIVFYNVENLFDTEDDPKTNDDEFTPKGAKGWSYRRYTEKLNNIYKVCTAVGGWEMPEIIALSEIENRKVLEDLLKKTPFRRSEYEIVHEDSPDARGIDLGLLYRKDKFKYLEHKAIPIVFPFDPNSKTRDILYVKGEVLGKDTLHIFVNHWPSRWGGQARSEPRRLYTAEVVRKTVDSLYAVDPNAKIVITGDFNDYATDKSIVETLGAKGDTTNLQAKDLFNYMAEISKNWQIGTHKYQGHWGTLDQMIVSAPLLKEQRPNKLYAKKANIFSASFLLEEDRRYLGLQPFRTYSGPRYLGGFADHLPIYIDLHFTSANAQ